MTPTIADSNRLAEAICTDEANAKKCNIKEIVAALPSLLKSDAKRALGKDWAEQLEHKIGKCKALTAEDMQFAILDEDGVRAAAFSAITIARANDGYSYSEAAGRPQHDFRWQCKQMRIKQRETLALIEIICGIVGGGNNQSKFVGNCSKERRHAENERTQQWNRNSCLVLPIWKEVNGVNIIVDRVSIPLEDAGNTKYKSISEFYGFSVAIKDLAAEAKRSWALVTLTPPAHMHQNSRKYDRHTTPHQANNFLSETKKAVSDTLKNWGCKITGIGTREAHKSATPHAHFAIAYDCKPKAIQQIENLHKFCGRRPLDGLYSEKQQEYISKKQYKKHNNLIIENWEEDFEFLAMQSPERLILKFEEAIFQNAWERHSYNLERDDHTGRLIMDIKNGVVSGVGVDIRKGENGDDAANFASYVMVYVMKSFGVDASKLPTDADARKKAIRDQVNAGGDLAFDAWRSAHRIRAREIFGLPARTPFKLLRKVRTTIKDAILENARMIARDEKRHTDYIKLMGGLNGKRNQRALETVRIKKDSNYALRPDLSRSVIMGVAAVKHIKKNIISKYNGKVIGTVLEAKRKGYQQTKINGITITTKDSSKSNEFKVTAKAINLKLESSVLLNKQELPKFVKKSHALISNYPSKAETSKFETDLEKFPMILKPKIKIKTENKVENYENEQSYIDIEARFWQEKGRISSNGCCLH